MNPNKLHNAITGTFLLIWLSVVIPLLKNIMGFGPLIFPRLPITQNEKTKLVVFSVLLAISLLVKAVSILSKPVNSQVENRRKIAPLMLLLIIFVPVAYGYVFDQDLLSVGQMILDIGTAIMDEDFDDIVPGEDPPGWEEESGEWYAVDDGDGNIVYYNDDDGDAEALTISTTGDTSWTDYSFMVKVKFVEGPTNKPNRGALLVYRYTSGNDYYYLAMREAQDLLEVYKHGSDSVGHRVGSVSCTLLQDTWYAVNITIRSNSVWISVDDTYYFTDHDMLGAHSQGSVGIGTRYYKVKFDDIFVELRE